MYITGVRTSTIQFDTTLSTPGPTGRSVAYGFHAAPGCSLNATQFVVDQGGYGFFNAGGTMSLTSGRVSHQLDAFGATAGSGMPEERLTLDGVIGSSNSVETVVRTAMLPTAAALPGPTPVCAAPPCG